MNDVVDGLYDLFGVFVFEQVTDGACLDGVEKVLALSETVSISMFIPGISAESRREASIPSLIGILRSISPNPPKDTDGRREDSGRGWVRELQGRCPGVLG